MQTILPIFFFLFYYCFFQQATLQHLVSATNVCHCIWTPVRAVKIGILTLLRTSSPIPCLNLPSTTRRCANAQGHLRLILLPIVYNAMAQKPEMRSLPLFHALHRAMKLSTYFPFLKSTEDPVQSKVVTRSGSDSTCRCRFVRMTCKSSNGLCCGIT